MLLEGNESTVRLSSKEIDGEIAPERDLLSREIWVTLEETGWHVMPKKWQGDSEAFQEYNELRGSMSWFFKRRRASVSTVRGVHGGKKGKDVKSKNRRRRRGGEGNGISAIGGKDKG